MKNILILLLNVFVISQVQAQAIPYTQEDKERLVKMETKLEELDKRMEVRFLATDSRIEQLEKRVDGRFEQLDKRLDFTNNLILALLVAIIGMTTFIWWDRKTALSPVEKKQEEALKKVIELEALLHSKGIL